MHQALKPILSLGSMFNTPNLFKDATNSGGYTGVNVVLGVSPDLDNPLVWSGILNLVARLAFETVACDLPLVATIGRKTDKALQLVIDFQNGPSDKSTGRLTITRPDSVTAVLASDNALCLQHLLNTMTLNPLAPVPPVLNPGDFFQGVYRPGKGLEGCTLNGAGLADDPVLIPHRPAAEKTPPSRPVGEKIDLLRLDRLYPAEHPAERPLTFQWLLASARLSAPTGIAISEALVACVMEATQMWLPMVSAGTEKYGCGTAFVIYETDTDPAVMGDAALSVTQAVSQAKIIVSGSPAAFQNGLRPWLMLALSQGGAALGRAETVRDTVGRWAASRPDRGRVAPVGPVDPSGGTQAEPTTPDTICHELRWPGESDAILAALGGVAAGEGRIVCDVYASKPAELRRQLQASAEWMLASKGYSPVVRVFNAFKPGLCRLLEYVLPRLANLNVAHIDIVCRPFTGIAGALELKHRWIHELFPGPEILARELGLAREQVVLAVDPNQAGSYTFKARNAASEPVFRDSFTPFTRTMSYHPAGSGQGTVSPTCAGIRIFKDEQLIMEQPIPTDRDRFWDLFQEQVVPDLLVVMEARLKAGCLMRPTTFFEVIDLDIAIDESDAGLGFRDERINPMEALQEDIYFFLLNMARQFADAHDLPPGIDIGRIVPRIRTRSPEGKPLARFRATPRSDRPLRPPDDTGRADYERFSICGDRWRFYYAGCPGGRQNSGMGSAVQPAAVAEPSAAPEVGFRIDENGCVLEVTLAPPPVHNGPARPAATRIPAVVIPEDRPLYAHEVEAILFELGRHPDIHVWEIARSTLGRPIYAVEAYHCPHDSVSIGRLARTRPTVLFNARHHANEVSSTTAVLKLLQYLCAEGNAILKTANVVCIPLENVDGVATFESLYVAGRGDMLHAARYNAVGAEFYSDYHREVPLFAEAWAKKRLWTRWLPELMADLHGVPGHEWCQPYAGYTPMGFEEFWLPRAFVWVHVPFLEDAAHPGYTDSLHLVAALREAVAGEPAIQAANHTLTALYHTYARQFEPDVFPNAAPGALAAHPLLGRARNYNYAVRHPDITRSEVVVEVPDEVVHGRELALCIRTHYIMQLALIGLLAEKRTAVVADAASSAGRRMFTLRQL
jgi:hypothetical protein